MTIPELPPLAVVFVPIEFVPPLLGELEFVLEALDPLLTEPPSAPKPLSAPEPVEQAYTANVVPNAADIESNVKDFI
jgi:hypothetical protein